MWWVDCADCATGQHDWCDGTTLDGGFEVRCTCYRDGHDHYPDYRDLAEDYPAEGGEAPSAVHTAYERQFGW